MINLENIEYKILGVLGLGITGLAAVKALCAADKMVFAFDNNEKSLNDIKNNQELKTYIDNKKLILADPKDWNWSKVESVLVSPGIPTKYPAPHPIFALAAEYEAHIISDIDLVQQVVPEATIFAITGTNGKSTTSSLIYHMLKSVDYRVEIGGNIGTSVLALNHLDQGIYVFEVSSFQLELIRDARFKIAIMLNISPDHQERYANMDDYIAAKKRIFLNQQDRDIAILGVDDIHSMRMYRALKEERKRGRIIPISCEQRFTGGVSIINNVLYNDIDSFNLDSNTGIELGNLPYLQGKHNGQNIAASYAAAYLSGVKTDECVAAIKSFKGLAHRMQYLGKKDNITYINDSKATNIDAAQKALQSFNNIYWIAGGKPKDKSIKALYREFKNIKHAYLIGEAKNDFAKDLEGKVPYTICDNLSQAFAQANLEAKSSDEESVLLLSPACSSYDQFKNFEERGELFAKLSESELVKKNEKII